MPDSAARRFELKLTPDFADPNLRVFDLRAAFQERNSHVKRVAPALSIDVLVIFCIFVVGHFWLKEVTLLTNVGNNMITLNHTQFQINS